QPHRHTLDRLLPRLHQLPQVLRHNPQPLDMLRHQWTALGELPPPQLRVRGRALPRRAAPLELPDVRGIVEYASAAPAITVNGRRHPSAPAFGVQALAGAVPTGARRRYAQAVQLAGNPPGRLAVGEPLEYLAHDLRLLRVDLTLSRL